MLSVFQTFNQVFEAGIAITALSLFFRALSFNLRDRVSRSFAILLWCVMLVFSGEALAGAATTFDTISQLIRFQWLGILFIPPAALHFSDALLETTGRPSRGRRVWVVRLSYVLSFSLTILLLSGFILKDIVYSNGYYYPQQSWFSTFFVGVYLLSAITAWVGVWRAYRRTRLKASRRRLQYLLTGLVILIIGSFPYLQFGSQFASKFPELFMFFVILGNIGLFSFMMLMAYAVAFFGVPWPDRVVRSRLVKWILRGPLTVFIVLSIMTTINLMAGRFGQVLTIGIPIFTVLTVLLMEHTITLVYPYIEQNFFHGGERENLQQLQILSERLITEGDLRQFLDAVLASVCDKFQVSDAFLAAIGDAELEIVVQVGKFEHLSVDDLQNYLLENVGTVNQDEEFHIFSWGEYWLNPLLNAEDQLIGLLGVFRHEERDLAEDLSEALQTLGDRAAMALEDHLMQQEVFKALSALNPKIERIQKLRAASRFDQNEIFRADTLSEQNGKFSRYVKDALSHFWGGPKLSENPLLKLNVVKQALRENDGNAVNALRHILRKAINQVKPEGERRFSTEWVLYNILEMKFVEGRKVREVAHRLAVSEADLYRKQRVAIEEVAKAIIQMEAELDTEKNPMDGENL